MNSDHSTPHEGERPHHGAAIRKTEQYLAPVVHPRCEPGDYDIYPAFPAGSGLIDTGFESLARRIAAERRVVMDGYGGVLWEAFRERLDAALRAIGVPASWHCVHDALLDEEEIARLTAPFLGGDDPLWGTRFTGGLRHFFSADRLAAIAPAEGAELAILYGTGAALAGWHGSLFYLDVPKNEIQFRSRAGSIGNLGARTPAGAKEAYKRFYFVDWPALNRHRAEIQERIDVIVDAQRPDHPVWMHGDDLRTALAAMSRNYFRARPWFEPGPWGGQWIRNRIHGLAKNVPNYAWSFELISPENGLMIESDGLLLETSFDALMIAAHGSVLGEAAARFGLEFPIRFDFLDTMDGGNLSVQCHPRPEYIRREFGENFTQDETYYILDCTPGARVYLGFREDIDPDLFRAELERSHREGVEIDMERFVNTEPAARGDLFLIPNGTIHCSGAGNLVLEISATPYIFTFKMYDWMRRDLEGNLRPLNIRRAFENLFFERRGARVREELVSKPRIVEEGGDWRILHLPTHPAQFYDVHRLEFATAIEVQTMNQCHVMMLVEGSSILLETAEGLRARFNHAETFVVPAAAGSYRLINQGAGTAKVVKAFVRSGAYS